ncbi:glycosyltransferase [Bosea sp. (in: a-proteobacteria)]|uniref:glycosyltransferase n=1 Tax=Bosea sp. (in: a-proteobacteria) TaxID=1871050 RepID=UPI00273733F8|nr:glycosyltransferase [Bosea sp. (in: a-proteobacteria)]MDP3407500.1 glycosyltransferase [Bosea sp. (in: a-proteobacteria)]
MDSANIGGLKPFIGLVCLSAIPDDPRVRRQGDLFHGRGWDVSGFGLPGARSPLPAWPCFDIENPGAASPRASGSGPGPGLVETPAGRLVTGPSATSSSGLPIPSPSGLRAIWHRIPPHKRRAAVAVFKSLTRPVFAILHRARRVKDLVLVHIDPAHAETTYWTLNDRFERLYRIAREHRPDIWLANDWTALPIVRRLAAEQGVPYAYDTHELAVDEYAERLVWRLTQRPVIAAIERAGITGSAVTSCVSQGIADRLHQLYGLREKPLLIRNMPQYEAHPYRPTGERIEVLYHGVVNVGRGLEACIDSVARWRPEFHLTIRGPGPAGYLAALASRIESAGLGGRVVLAPPVPMIDLVREAARFDVGLFALPGHSQQNVHVLPNKFFEYTMAGLALCVSDLPEMTALLRQHDLGRLIPDVTPEAIATAINGFDRAGIDACKERALAAARVLNWEAEADRLFAAIEQAVVPVDGLR